MKDAPGAATSKPLVNERRQLPTLKLVEPAVESPVWSAPADQDGAPITSHVLNVPIGSVPHEIEPKMIEILCRARRPDENHAESGMNREIELREVMADLDVTAAFHLRRRLEMNRAGDPLCVSFQRLVVERRQRLLRFLGDARRRMAEAQRG